MIKNSDGSVASPCVNWCEMNPKNQFCFGCYRTIDEIANWGKLSEAEKIMVWKNISLRKLQTINPS
jgi:predicted Fe-S protein YdhL (DUF1289 family)